MPWFHSIVFGVSVVFAVGSGASILRAYVRGEVELEEAVDKPSALIKLRDEPRRFWNAIGGELVTFPLSVALALWASRSLF